MFRSRASRRRGQDGAAAVEFALVVPILLLLVFGIITYGFMLSFRQSVSQAAAEGARAAAVAPATADRPAIAKAAVAEVMGVTCGSTYLVCTISTPSTCSSCISVEVVYAYKADPSKPVLPGVGLVVPTSLSYTAVSEIAS